MQRTTMLPENWWALRAEAAAGNAAAQDVVALRAEIEQLQRALAGRAVIDQACGMVMVLAPCRRGPARNLLMDMARQCNTKLPDVAAAVVAAWEGEPLSRFTCSPAPTCAGPDHRPPLVRGNGAGLRRRYLARPSPPHTRP